MDRERIPLTVPLTGEEEVLAAAEVIRSGWLTQGPKTAAFEKAVAEYVGAAHGVAATSCTTALVLALLVSGVGPGDEVVTTPYSFIATANSIMAVGARPVFADIDLDTFNLTPESAAAKITPKTKAVMPVHQVGLPCDLDGFEQLARDRGLALVEDAACALGSRYKGRPVGRTSGPGHTACFSFHPRKLISTGEGGMITTNDDGLAARSRSLTSHGATISEAQKHAAQKNMAPQYLEVGFNYRLSDILAAIGLAQMERLPGILRRRRELSAQYREAFCDHPRIISPRAPDWAEPNHQSFQIRLDGAGREERDSMVNALRDQGVMATPGVADIHRHEVYVRLLGPQHFPHAETAADTSIILPLFPQMADADLERCARTVLDLAG